MSRQRSPKPAAALLLACAIVAALLPAGAGAATERVVEVNSTPERTVAVTAKATLKVPNDLATFGIGVKRERRTRGAALKATSAELRKVIVAVQKVKGVGAGDVVTGRVSVRPVKRGSVTVFRAREGAKVSLHEPANSGTLVARALAAGATGFSGPYFSVGNEEAAFGKVLAAAYDKAEQRASVLAREAGMKLGKAIVIEEGQGRLYTPGGSFSGSFFEEEVREVIHPPPSVAAPVPALVPPPPPPTKPGRSTVDATVHVVFELLPNG
jgi:uncharacterized protein